MSKISKNRKRNKGNRPDKQSKNNEPILQSPIPGLYTADQTPFSMFTSDSFSNPAARLGAFTDSIAESAEYFMNRITQDMNLMNTLYRGNWIVKRIIDAMPEDMMKNGYKINSQIDIDSRNKLIRLERTTRLRSKILEGLKWGRLYGGAAGVIVIDGHEDILDQPLELDMVMPDSFKGLIILDRWSGIVPEAETVDDPGSPDFGLPKYYSIRDDNLGYNTIIHHSRVVRFIGRDLPYIEKLSEIHWGASELEHVFDELKKRDNTSYNIASLVFRANLHVYSMDGMEELAMMPTKTRQALMETLYMLNAMMNNNGTQVIGPKDKFDTKQFSFGGLSEIYELFMMDIAGAGEYPVTRLFGRSPAGMNATGESDMRNYEDTIAEKSERELRPVYDTLLPIMCVSAFGAVPDDLDYEFLPLHLPTESEKKTIAGQITTSVVSLHNAGIISQKTALKELRDSQELTGMWQSITDEDIEAANDSIMGGDLPLPNLVEPPPDPVDDDTMEASLNQSVLEISEEIRRMKPFIQNLI